MEQTSQVEESDRYVQSLVDAGIDRARGVETLDELKSQSSSLFSQKNAELIVAFAAGFGPYDLQPDSVPLVIRCGGSDHGKIFDYLERRALHPDVRARAAEAHRLLKEGKSMTDPINIPGWWSGA